MNSPGNSDDSRDSSRIDKWLWVARFYKTRSLAAKAINAGHVRLNDNRIKSSKTVVIGDSVLVKKNNLEYNITVTGILQTRVSATIASTLYQESNESILARENTIKDKRFFNSGYKSSDGRPSKQDRRDIQKLTGRLK